MKYEVSYMIYVVGGRSTPKVRTLEVTAPDMVQAASLADSQVQDTYNRAIFALKGTGLSLSHYKITSIRGK